MDLVEAVRNANVVFIIGNGGSYANAQHMANDLLACGIFAVTMDPASLTASANDFGYETVFSRWIGLVGKEDDLLIALSGSGRSKNILNALATAKEMGIKTVAMLGAFGDCSPAAKLADLTLSFGHDMQAAEEYQIMHAHSIMRTLKEKK